MLKHINAQLYRAFACCQNRDNNVVIDPQSLTLDSCCNQHFSILVVTVISLSCYRCTDVIRGSTPAFFTTRIESKSFNPIWQKSSSSCFQHRVSLQHPGTTARASILQHGRCIATLIEHKNCVLFKFIAVFSAFHGKRTLIASSCLKFHYSPNAQFWGELAAAGRPNLKGATTAVCYAF